FAGCGDPEAEAAARAAAQAAAEERAAEEAERAFEAALADGNWELAKAHGDLLLAKWPSSQAATRIAGRHAEASAKAREEAEARRLAALWSHQSQPVTGGQPPPASLYAPPSRDLGGSRA